MDTMDEALYDVCVVGAGMVGSAAAKWLSLKPGTKVCLIGPAEPTPEEWSSGKREIFASHYDEGRLCREMDEDLMWAILAQRSIARYRQLEAETGINFYTEVGCIFVAEEGTDRIPNTIKHAETMGVTKYKVLNARQFEDEFRYLHAMPGTEYLWNFKNAGHISPRRLVAAQQQVARTHGCHIETDVAVKIEGGDDGSRREVDEAVDFVRVTCQGGRVLLARRVLLCTGAFTNCHDLLPEGEEVDIHPSQTTVVKAEITEGAANRMMDMPSFLSLVEMPDKFYYLLPPIKYPDGKYYLKIGGYKGGELHNLQELADWFRTQADQDDWRHRGMEIMKEIIPDLEPLSVSTACCASSFTPSDRLFCDMISPRLGATVGMTGRGAKSSDEIGRMGALMIAKGSWDYDLPAENFKLQYRERVGGK